MIYKTLKTKKLLPFVRWQWRLGGVNLHSSFRRSVYINTSIAADMAMLYYSPLSVFFWLNSPLFTKKILVFLWLFHYIAAYMQPLYYRIFFNFTLKRLKKNTSPLHCIGRQVPLKQAARSFHNWNESCQIRERPWKGSFTRKKRERHTIHDTRSSHRGSILSRRHNFFMRKTCTYIFCTMYMHSMYILQFYLYINQSYITIY